MMLCTLKLFLPNESQLNLVRPSFLKCLDCEQERSNLSRAKARDFANEVSGEGLRFEKSYKSHTTLKFQVPQRQADFHHLFEAQGHHGPGREAVLPLPPGDQQRRRG